MDISGYSGVNLKEQIFVGVSFDHIYSDFAPLKLLIVYFGVILLTSLFPFFNLYHVWWFPFKIN